jgi:hypothetical protein
MIKLFLCHNRTERERELEIDTSVKCNRITKTQIEVY